MNMEEFLEGLANRNKDTSMIEVPIAGMQFAIEGKNKNLVLVENGESMLFSEGTEKDICGLIEVPYVFENKCPDDLRVSVMNTMKNRWLSRMEGDEVLYCVRKDNIFLSVSKKKREYIDSYKLFTDGILPAFVAVDIKDIELNTLSLGEEIFTQLVLPDMGKEVRVGDVVKGGLEVIINDRWHSGDIVTVGGYFYRLVCTNGATIMENVGSRMGIRDDYSIPTVYNSALVSLDRTKHTINHLSELANSRVADPQRYIRNIVSEMGRNSERLEKAIYNSYLVENDATEYGVYNAVTRAANGNISVAAKRALQRAGGSLFAKEVERCELCKHVL